ncbi:MAG: hypothetical protein HWE27_05305 [Gammaproteobacteria bacterium]|nr:hypothetical protein [Gammaproteobacteria bacterium]
MSIRKDYYDLHQAIRMRNAICIYSVCCRVGFDVVRATDIALSDKGKPRSLDLRLLRYKRMGELVPKRYRM